MDMDKLWKAIATVGIWVGMAIMVSSTKNTEIIGWAVGGTFIIWFLG